MDEVLKTLESNVVGLKYGVRERDDSERDTPSPVRVGYLLSRYPAISHTFLLSEVLGLRQRGMQIETASINLPDRSVDLLPQREAEEARRTHYVQNTSWMSAGWSLFCILVSHPAVMFRGIRAVISVRNLTMLRRAYWFFYLAEALLVGLWMRRLKLKHLHVHFGGPVASVGLLASAAWRIPFSITIHGPEELLDVSSYHLREKFDRASFVFCISDFCRSQLYQLMAQEHWRKLHVIRLGVDPSLLAPAKNLSRKHNPVLEVVCIARLVPAKGHRVLLEALLLLRDQDVALNLVLVGGGPEMGALRDFVRAHDLSNSVTFTQALSHGEALDQLRSADIFVLASFAEGIPVALMEAMALGIPCVSTFVAGIPELIRDGVDGVMVAPGNAPELAKALLALATDRAFRLAMGEAARRRIIEQYNLPRNQDLLAETFERLLNGRDQCKLAKTPC